MPLCPCTRFSRSARLVAQEATCASDSCASPGWLAAAPGQTRATIWKMQPDGVLCRATTRELGLEALAGILACTYAFDAIHSK